MSDLTREDIALGIIATVAAVACIIMAAAL